MKTSRLARCLAIAMLFGLANPLLAETPASNAAATPAPHLIDRFKALAGEWSAEGQDGNSDPTARVRYEVTGGGSTVVETMFPGAPHEMRTVFFRDGSDLVLTHYCAGGNHPTMRAKSAQGDTVAFEFDHAANFDPAVASHMHDARFVFVGADEIRAQWTSWSAGKPGGHVAEMHLKRVK